ncbi:MAG: hypothetical protein U0790_08510 [Isosphaeraceae bacterium]
MSRPKNGRVLCWGLLLASVSSAPMAQETKVQEKPAPQPSIASLAERRQRAAAKQFDLVWQYHRQDRVDTFDVYLWSRLLLDSRRELASKPADRIAACQEHLDRMKDLEALVKKIRRLGFGRSNDVGASEYWRIEAETWLAEARAG